MNKSQRIYFNTEETGNDKYVKVRLEQNVKTLEFLTMRLGTEDVYQSFNSDYGVLIGRVLANGGIGIPNAKISVFIPLSDIDAENGEIASIYPYKTPRDKNNDGKRYNLLPRVSRKDPNTGVVSPKQPFGSFPIKEEIVTNEPFLNVYKKYYKYTALTNDSGDYMIFGVPVGTQTIHLSVDITDIGEYSMNAASMVTNLGYSPNLFTDNNSKIKPSSDLNDLPNIETQEISVDIIPFWGDVENFEIGITRQDFRIRSVLKNTFVIFGSVFTDAREAMWGDTDSDDDNKLYLLYRMSDVRNSSFQNMGIGTKLAGTATEKIYYYPEKITDHEIGSGDFVDQMLLLDKSEYSVYKQNGDFVLILSCNRKRIIINEQGIKVPAGDSPDAGLFTEFRGFMTLEITPEDLPLDWVHHGENLYMKPLRQILKFPQHAIKGSSFRTTGNGNDSDDKVSQDNYEWRKEHFTFCGGNLYSVSRFHGVVFNASSNADDESVGSEGFTDDDIINDLFQPGLELHVGEIITSNYKFTGNTVYEMCGNSSRLYSTCSISTFGANWLNMSVYLPQIGWVCDNYNYVDGWRTNTQFTANPKKNTYYLQNNQQSIAGSYVNTCGFARSDLNWTDFIQVSKTDVCCMNSISTKGFKTDDDGKTITTSTGQYPLEGTYRNGTCNPNTGIWCSPAPICGGKCNGKPTCAADGRTYFFKGVDTSDTVAYLMCLGIV
jgi:hypothetical protein